MISFVPAGIIALQKGRIGMRKKIVGLTALLCCGLLGGLAAQAADEAAAHKVRKGETLWEISGTHLKDPKAWPKVWKQNPKIKNPDQIKPGQVVKLPGKAKAKAKAKVKQPAVAKPAPAPAMPVVERSGPPLALTVIREEPLKPKVAEGARIIRHTRGVGEIAEALPGDGKVLVTQAGWSSDTIGSTIFVQAADATVGTTYGVYRDLGRVPHPGLFRFSPGRLLVDIGMVEIMALQGDRQLAKIIKSYDAVQQGDLLGAPLVELAPLAMKNHTDAISATVVALENNRLLAAPRDIVYLDAGSEQGLAPGDRLRIGGADDREGRRQSAAVAVLTVTPTTAAALVLPESDHQVNVGDRVGPAL